MEFTYDKLSGTFYKNGEQYTCSRSNKYLTVYYEGRNVYAHRLAFFLEEGVWPSDDVDHINGDKKDNRWSNLRKATRSQNLMNKSGKRVLPKNVYWIERVSKYRVKFKIKGKMIDGGYWDNVVDATVMALLLREHYHGEYHKA